MDLSSNTTVKLRKVGNSQAIIIPSSFLKELGNTPTIEMKIESNKIHLIFAVEKSLNELIEEKRGRNQGLMTKMMKKIEKIDPVKYEKDYIIRAADDLID